MPTSTQPSSWYLHLVLWLGLLIFHQQAAAAQTSPYFEIQIVDADTGRGVPLVQLTTVHHVTYVTDNAGRVAFHEPALAGQQIHLTMHSHGYEVPVDGFGIAGIKVTPQPGGRSEVRLQRRNMAERLYRITGQGLYRDSLLLAKPTPLREPYGPARIAGQDSAFGVPYRGQVYWFWGDTNRLAYPLGLYRTAGATSRLPGQGSLPVDQGIDFTYFTGKDGFCRAMAEVANPEGVVWNFGISTAPDARGTERLFTHYARRKGLDKIYEHGVMVYQDDRDIMTVQTTLPLTETWRFPAGQPVKVTEQGQDYLYFGAPFPQVRVPARLEAVLDTQQYEAYYCQVQNGTATWCWQKEQPPTSPKEAYQWLREGKIKADQARFLPTDSSQPDRHIILHTGSVRWNTHRKKWIMIAVEDAYHVPESPSPLGEVWYSEADSPVGPFRQAVKILTHDKYTFYNPVHHPFFDQEGGRFIYFEGTYTNQFVNSPPTPLYDYNQIMYRLDLERQELKAVFGLSNHTSPMSR